MRSRLVTGLKLKHQLECITLVFWSGMYDSTYFLALDAVIGETVAEKSKKIAMLQKSWLDWYLHR